MGGGDLDLAHGLYVACQALALEKSGHDLKKGREVGVGRFFQNHSDLPWGNSVLRVSVGSLWRSIRPGGHFSLGSPHKADPKTRIWGQGVYLGHGLGNVREWGRETGMVG